MKIAIVGTGYVGLSNAVILAQHHEVWALDLDERKVAQVNRRESPIVDPELEDYLRTHALDLRATLDKDKAYADADFVVVATPTDYDPVSNYFDTRSVESVTADALAVNPDATIVIKPTGCASRTRAPRSSSPRSSFARAGRSTTTCTRPG